MLMTETSENLQRCFLITPHAIHILCWQVVISNNMFW